MLDTECRKFYHIKLLHFPFGGNYSNRRSDWMFFNFQLKSDRSDWISKGWRRNVLTFLNDLKLFSTVFVFSREDIFFRFLTIFYLSFISLSLLCLLAYMFLKIDKWFSQDCMQRTIPFYVDTIVPDSIAQGKNVLIASSENAIRGLLMHLCEVPKTEVVTTLVFW